MRGFTALAVFLGFGMVLIAVGQHVDSTCLDCIGKVENGPPNKCIMDVGSLSCGKYQIKYNYWLDCKQGTDWKSCSFDETCARQCISTYMMRYAGICARELSKSPQDLTCLDLGRLHNGGPHGCSKTSTLAYDDAMRAKCGL